MRKIARIRITLENLPISLEIDIVDMHNIPDEPSSILHEGVLWKD